MGEPPAPDRSGDAPAVDYVASFESAWSTGAESDLPLADYSRRRLVLRRQRIAHLAKMLGWRFLKVGESLPSGDCLLVGLRLDSLRDLHFLDLLRAQSSPWEGCEICLFQVERPYVLSLARWPSETPAIAVIEGGRPRRHREGDAAFRYVAGGGG